MITRKEAGDKVQKKGKVKVDKLRLSKETVKDLASDALKEIKGGMRRGESGEPGVTCYDCTEDCETEKAGYC